MKTIRAIFRNGTLTPLDPIDLPENTALMVALLDSDDISGNAIAALAQSDASFEFLNNSLDACYTHTDGEAV